MSAILTAAELEAIQRCAEAATAGPWRVRAEQGLWWTVETELPSINGLRCWYTVARFDFDSAADGYTSGALDPEADAAFLAIARSAIPRLLADLKALAAPREALAKWMITHSFATGPGDTTDELLGELTYQVRELRAKLWEAREQRDEALASAPARDATPSAPAGEYARAIEDAARLVDKRLGCLSDLAAAIRGLSPAPREDARLAGLRHAHSVLRDLMVSDQNFLRRAIEDEIARLSLPQPTGA